MEQILVNKIESLLTSMKTNTGVNLHLLNEDVPVLLIFLRHFGCTFCKEALYEISKNRKDIERGKVTIVFVHNGTNELADKYFKKYKIANPIYVTDQEGVYYKSFGLTKGNFNQLLGLKVFMRGFEAGILNGHGIGTFLGDAFQMPGIFLIFKNLIRDSYIHKISADKPDYVELTKCCVE